jgi:nucleoside 2-deoxyribosyltransferase
MYACTRFIVLMPKGEGIDMSNTRKIYFAVSIRGGRDRAEVYTLLRDDLAQYGIVLTEHVADISLTSAGEVTKDDELIYERDIAWVSEADVLVAEVTNPSHGVGGEIYHARAQGKPVLCLYWIGAEYKLSAMISGRKDVTIFRYQTIEEAKAFLSEQFMLLDKGKPV